MTAPASSPVQSPGGSPVVPAEPLSFFEAATGAIRYWEPRRAAYNGILVLVVIAQFWVGLPTSKTQLSIDLGIGIFILAVIANLLYCAAYVPDVFIQRTAFRHLWLRSRYVLFLLGTAFASAIGYFISRGIFVSGVGAN